MLNLNLKPSRVFLRSEVRTVADTEVVVNVYRQDGVTYLELESTPMVSPATAKLIQRMIDAG